MSKKTQLLIEVNCGEMTCQGCDFYGSRSESCELFQRSLVDDCVRCAECIAAEQRARDLKLGTATRLEPKSLVI